MKVVILGASGQIGNTLYEALSKKYEMTGTSRRPRAKLLQFDPFMDHWSVLGRPAVIINTIGQIDASRDYSFARIHLDLTKRIIENRSVLGNPRIIQVSALGASANHEVQFLRTKGEADDYLTQFPDVAVIRPSIVCTHRTMIVKKMLMLFRISKWTGGIVVVPRGFSERQIQPVMAEDVAAIVDKLCSAHEIPKALNLTGPERLSFHRIIKMMFEAQGRKHRIVQIPKFWTDILARYLVGAFFPSVINAQQYELLFKDNVADHSEAQEYLGRPLQHTKDFWIKEFSDYAPD